MAAPTDIEARPRVRDDAAAAWRAVARLPGDRRRAVILRFVDEMSTAEIAGVLGRSEGAVRVLIHRALRSVARDLGDTPAVTWASAGRDSDEVDALVTDRYLESLLAAHARGADARPGRRRDRIRSLRQTMARLARDLPRFHPSFRFEEALADRLAEAAADAAAAAAGADGPSPAAGSTDPARRTPIRDRADRRRTSRAAIGPAAAGSAARSPRPPCRSPVRPTSPGGSAARRRARWPGPSAPWPGRGSS